MTITEKLSRLLRTKQRIREEIIKKGVDVDETEPFSNYAGKISLIETGGTTISEPLTFFNEKFAYSKNMNLDNLKNCNWAQTDFANMFYECRSLVSCKNVNFKNSASCTSFADMFRGCAKLEDIDVFDTSSGANFSGMFYDCEVLESIPEINVSNGTDFSYFLADTFHLTEVPTLDYTKGTNFTGFLSYSGVSTIPALDFSSGTNFQSAFYGSSISTIPEINISNGTNFKSTFGAMPYLTEIAELDFSKATTMDSCFAGCSSLVSLPAFNTSHCQIFSNMFNGCNKLEKVTSVDVQGASAVYSDFGSVPNLRYLVVKNLGSRAVHNYFYFNKLTSWGVNSDTITNARQSLIDSLITYSYDRAGNNVKYSFKLHLSEATAAVLTDDEIAQITDKGYTISVA